MHTSGDENYNWMFPDFRFKLLVKMAEDAQYS